MKKIRRFKKNVRNYLFDHPILKTSLSYFFGLCVAALSSFAFAFGFDAFILPAEGGISFVTGGLSGISQSIILVMQMCGFNALGINNLQSIIYFILNVPIIIFAFIKIGKKFTILSTVTVILSSVFISTFASTGFVAPIQSNPWVASSPILRAMFGGACVGFSSAIAFKCYISAGGMDIVSYYISLVRSKNTGKYGIIINVIILIFYCVISIIYKPNDWSTVVVSFGLSVIYQVIIAVVIDIINVRNKKLQLQIISSNENLSDVLLTNFPHGLTEMNGIGAYSHKEKKVLVMVISSIELTKVVRLIKSVDPKAFIEVTDLVNVYGNFYINPIE